MNDVSTSSGCFEVKSINSKLEGRIKGAKIVKTQDIVSMHRR